MIARLRFPVNDRQMMVELLPGAVFTYSLVAFTP